MCLNMRQIDSILYRSSQVSRAQAIEKAAEMIFSLCAFTAVGAVFSITLYMIANGVPAVFQAGVKEILFTTVWQPTATEPSFGILYVILTSIIGTFLAVLLGVPVGILAAVFLAEVAPRRLAAVVRPAVELLAGIPSVIYGVLGMMILNPLMYRLEQRIFADSQTHQFTGGANLLSAVFVLALMILPTVINISEAALLAVPPELKASSLALGASPVQTIFQVTIPAARSGILAAVVLGVGRAVGEAMAISLVSGNSSISLGTVSHHGHCQRDGVCGRSAQAGSVYDWSGAVYIHHDHQRDFKQHIKGGKAGMMRKLKDDVLLCLIYLAAFGAEFLLLGILVYVFVKGFPYVDLQFLTTVTSVLQGTVGIAGNMVNTIYIVVLTLVIAVPIGIGSAIYLNEYARPGKMVRLITFATQTLAGIPSILFGLFGMMFFGITLGLGYSILTGALTLSLMVLPLITRNTQEALLAVPESYKSGALSMGAGKWYMIRTILLPSAMPGIVTGVILAVGRIMGESAALLFTAGSGYLLPRSAGGWFHKVAESGGTLTIQLYLSMSKAQYDVVFGIAVVLLCILFCMNLIMKFFAKYTTESQR